ncbi:hypothetical protein [Rubripirellula tenax]|nr:hypothetical protein [Rubripirellula tenax]
MPCDFAVIASDSRVWLLDLKLGARNVPSLPFVHQITADNTYFRMGDLKISLGLGVVESTESKLYRVNMSHHFSPGIAEATNGSTLGDHPMRAQRIAPPPTEPVASQPNRLCETEFAGQAAIVRFDRPYVATMPKHDSFTSGSLKPIKPTSTITIGAEKADAAANQLDDSSGKKSAQTGPDLLTSRVTDRLISIDHSKFSKRRALVAFTYLFVLTLAVAAVATLINQLVYVAGA